MCRFFRRPQRNWRLQVEARKKRRQSRQEDAAMADSAGENSIASVGRVADDVTVGGAPLPCFQRKRRRRRQQTNLTEGEKAKQDKQTEKDGAGAGGWKETQIADSTCRAG